MEAWPYGTLASHLIRTRKNIHGPGRVPRPHREEEQTPPPPTPAPRRTEVVAAHLCIEFEFGEGLAAAGHLEEPVADGPLRLLLGGAAHRHQAVRVALGDGPVLAQPARLRTHTHAHTHAHTHTHTQEQMQQHRT